jgi:hypothetical protein
LTCLGPNCEILLFLLVAKTSPPYSGNLRLADAAGFDDGAHSDPCTGKIAGSGWMVIVWFELSKSEIAILEARRFVPSW